MGKFGQQRRLKSIGRRIKQRQKRQNAIERRQAEIASGKLRKKKKGSHPHNGTHRQAMKRHHRFGITVGGRR